MDDWGKTEVKKEGWFSSGKYDRKIIKKNVYIEKAKAAKIERRSVKLGTRVWKKFDVNKKKKENDQRVQ